MEEQMDFFHDESSIHAAGDDQQNVKRGVVMECVRSSRSADRLFYAGVNDFNDI
uniref:Uncharacterized protein n=1 Tax=Oryza sativa subsp. japonica TaxID=39947 RepID=Q6ERV5_ORYSJ|nr:hypothetical protein [Oryza sativa Japonica Group]BAD28615.1 hypothetical protein [Oryza sativa Japonica Group]